MAVSMRPRRPPLSVRHRTTYHSVEHAIGCKWSAAVVAALLQADAGNGSAA
jgi:hypothetical protein